MACVLFFFFFKAKLVAEKPRAPYLYPLRSSWRLLRTAIMSNVLSPSYSCFGWGRGGRGGVQSVSYSILNISPAERKKPSKPDLATPPKPATKQVGTSLHLSVFAFTPPRAAPRSTPHTDALRVRAGMAPGACRSILSSYEPLFGCRICGDVAPLCSEVL